MSNFSDFFGGGGIKSIQRGVTTPPTQDEVLVTVAAVNPAKAMLNLLSNMSDPANISAVSLRLVNATTIGIISTSNAVQGRACSWELIEFA